MKVGIMSKEQFQKHILDIAAGRKKLNKDNPKVWFSSMESLNEAVGETSATNFPKRIK